MRFGLPLILLLACVCGGAEKLPVGIRVSADQPVGEFVPIWRYFGYDEANYTYMKDGRKLLGELGNLSGSTADAPQVFIRCHHLMTSGDGVPALKWSSTNIYTQDAQGNAVYNWTIADRIFDTYRADGLRPYAEIGFMPEALSIHPQNYPQHPPADKMAPADAGQAYPPSDYNKWAELVFQWVHHCVGRYGADEVGKWYWEVWNEPNISYWHGGPQEYFKLYDYTVDAVRRALPGARVGGPETAGGPGGPFLHNFLEHCANGVNAVTGQTGAPLDFISFHAKGRPSTVDGHVRMGMSNELHDIDGAFGVIASFPQFKDKPIVIGECDPEGCAACRGPQDAYRNGTVYSSYTAAVFPRVIDLAQRHGVNLQGALTWAFEFENQPYFAGFRALATNGIDLPVLNVFRMMAQMQGQRLAVQSDGGHDVADILSHGIREAPDVSAMATLDANQLAILVWHYHDDDVAGPEAAVELRVVGLPSTWKSAEVEHFRVDADHSNSFSAWQKMGSPQALTEKQRADLELAGHLAQLDKAVRLPIAAGQTSVHFDLPRQGVSLLVLRQKIDQ